MKQVSLCTCGNLSMVSRFIPQNLLRTSTPRPPISFTQIRMLNENQRKKSLEFYKQVFPTSYYFDEEKASRDQQIRSLDCIMDTSISKPGYGSWASIKKHISMYMRTKRLKERRPDLTKKAICRRYLEYKALTHSTSEVDLCSLGEYTTEGETKRIVQLQRQKKYESQRASSWKNLSMKFDQSPNESQNPSQAREKNESADLAIERSHYSLKLDEFELVGGFYGSINQDDWLQLNYRAVGKEALRENDGSTGKITENDILEYVAIEIHLTDGVRKRNTYQPIVVGIMDRNGARYGRDGADAVSMRKQITKGNSWFS